jgi:hypothetical protein
MPQFIDYHEHLPKLPAEAVAAMRNRIKARKRDEFGVKPLNVLVGNGDGYCLTDAPDAAAVVASHKAQGFPLRRKDVKQVTPIA